MYCGNAGSKSGVNTIHKMAPLIVRGEMIYKFPPSGELCSLLYKEMELQ